MRRLAVVFALIALMSAAMRIATPERDAAVSGSRIQRAFTRACLFFAKKFRPLLPVAN
jgi:hypothetical protein